MPLQKPTTSKDLTAQYGPLRNALRRFRHRLEDPGVVKFSPAITKLKGTGFHHKEAEFVPHTNLATKETAFVSVTHFQKLIIVGLLVILALAFYLNWHLTFVVLFAVITFAYFADLLFNLFLVYRSFSKSPEITVSAEEIASMPADIWPKYTVFCPLYKEWQVLPQFIEAMHNLDYPKSKLQVMLQLEEDDTETISRARAMDLPEWFTIVVVPNSKPKTKPKAMNYGLQHATGEFIVIYDAEDVPDPLQLKKAFIAFFKSDPEIVCIQAKLNFYNPHQNLLTRVFTAEYSLWFDLILPGIQSINGPIPLGGTSNHFKAEKIRELDGWDAFNVTEDCDLGMRLVKRGYRTAIVDSTTHEEANSDLLNWYRQRSRWIKGYIQSYLVHMRRPGELMTDWKNPQLIYFQFVVGGKILSMFINPFMWVITIVYFVFRAQAGPFIESFFPSAVLYVGVTALIFGNFLYLYYYMIGCAKRGHYSLIKYAFVVPFYWLMMSAAAWQALYEVIRKPHYWAKTVHGLHLADKKVAMEQDVDTESGFAQGTQTKTAPILIPEFESSLSVEASVYEEPITAATEPQTWFSKGKSAASLVSSNMTAGTWFVAANMIANVLNFLFNAVLGRSLSLSDFATVSLFNTFLSLFGVLLAGLGSSVNYQVAFLSGGNKKGWINSFLNHTLRKSFLYSVLLTVVWLALIPVTMRFFQVESTSLVLLFTPVIIFGALSSIQSGFLKGEFLFGLLGRAIVIEALSKLVFAVALVQLGFPQAASLALPASIVVSWFVTYMYTAKALRAKGVVSPDNYVYEFPRKYFSATLITAASAAAFLNFDVLLAKHYLTPELAGRYALLSLVGKMVYFFGSILATFTVSIVSRHEGAGTDSRQDFYRLFKGILLTSLVAFLGVGVFGFITVPILLGDKAEAILPYLFNYSLAMVFFVISGTIIAYHTAKREYKFSFIALISSILLVVSIRFFHDSISQIATVMLVVSSTSLFSSVIWHAVSSNSRFILRNLTDLFDMFAPLPQLNYKGTGKRILVFNWRDTTHAYAGGAEVYIHELAKRWVEAGHRVTMFTGNDGKQTREETIEGVDVIRRGGFYFVYVWAFFYYMFRFRGRFDTIIDCQNGLPFFTPLYANEDIYCLLHHVHQDVFRQYLSRPLAALATFMEGKLMPWAYRDTTFITISDSSRKDMESLNMGLAGISIIHPGVNLEAMTPGEKAVVPLVVYLGRLKAYKSVDMLIAAFRKTLESVPDARLIVAGDGEERFALEAFATDLGLEDQVEFVGKISERQKTRLLQRAWVFVNPSMMEGWGITTIEANACGTPVVASDVPGLRDSVSDLHSGYLVQYGDVNEMADKITYLLRNHKERQKMATNAVEWAQNFDWDVMAKRSLRLIED